MLFTKIIVAFCENTTLHFTGTKYALRKSVKDLKFCPFLPLKEQKWISVPPYIIW